MLVKRLKPRVTLPAMTIGAITRSTAAKCLLACIAASLLVLQAAVASASVGGGASRPNEILPTQGAILSGYASMVVSPGGANLEGCSGASTTITVTNAQGQTVARWTNSGGSLSTKWLTDTVPNGAYTVSSSWVTSLLSGTSCTLEPAQSSTASVTVTNGPKPYVGSPGATPSRPVTCPPLRHDPNTASSGEVATQTGTFPWPPAPAGANPEHYSAYDHTPAMFPPLRPANWANGGNNWKLTSARSPNPQVATNPQELCGVRGNSVDTAWQTTTGRPTTVIAVIDSGIEWCDTGIVNKIFLNRQALPYPENAQGLTKPQLEAQGVNFADSDPYDLNNSGVLNVLQYANDPRVQAVAKAYGGLFCSVARGSYPAEPGLVSPMDLIRTFGTPTMPGPNGTVVANPYYDPSQSPAGFTAAIAGWNFVDNNNNAYDTVHYDHGTGEAKDMAGTANTLSHEVGACPNCMILPIRAGDSFMTTGNLFAQGVLFAVDSGATIVSSAQGSMDITAPAREAIAYANAHGVPVVASAADEASQHHNLPGVLSHTIVVNSVTSIAQRTGFNAYSPPSYLYLNGCTNYGANIAVSVESASCSSEATGKAAGIVGLAESAARDAVSKGIITNYPGLTSASGAPVPLSANELKQLVTMGANSVNFANSAGAFPSNNYNVTTNPGYSFMPPTSRYPSQAGYNIYFGYGRINASTIVSRISQGLIPPEAELYSPSWFQPFSPNQTLQVTGRVAAVRAASYQYQVLISPGAQPQSNSWTLVASGSGTGGLSGAISGTLATIPMSKIASLFPPGTNFAAPPVLANGSPNPNAGAFTVLVQVKDSRGLVGMARRTDFIHSDPTLLPGYPRRFASSLIAPPKLAPLGPGGKNVLIVVTAGGTINAFLPNGTELPGWPVHTNPLPYHAGEQAFTSGAITAVPRGEILGGVAVGDLSNAKGSALDVVATDMAGNVYAWNAKGQLLPGFPEHTNPQFSAPSAVGPNNRLLPGIGAAPALADLQGNGTLDIVAAAMDRHVYAWQPNGQAVPGWPVLVVDPAMVSSVNPVTNKVTFKPGANPIIGTKLVDTPAIGNLNGSTGPPDVIVGSNQEYPGPMNANVNIGVLGNVFGVGTGNGRVFAIYPNGSLHSPATNAPNPPGFPNPGAFLPGWPAHIGIVDPGVLPDIGDGISNSPALASVAGNGQLQVAVNSEAGPAYLLNPNGTSWLGSMGGLDNVMAMRGYGPQSNSNPLAGSTLPALGGAILAPLGGKGAPGISLISPAISRERALDQFLPGNQALHQSQVDAWNVWTGKLQPAFPQQMNDMMFLSQPIVANVASNGPYVVAGSSLYDLRAINSSGQEAPGFPKMTAGWIASSPVFGPFGNLPYQVLAAGTREGYLFAWSTSTPASAPSGPWPQGHHDLWNTNNLNSPATPAPTRPPAKPRSPIVAMAATPGGNGYWEVSSDGGVFSFGSAVFHGSLPSKGIHPSAPIVDIVSTPSGSGYWLIGSDGGVFSFGNAVFHGSLPSRGIHSSAPIVGMAATPRGNGYHMVSSDGGVFSFGDAGFHGSLASVGVSSHSPIVGIASTVCGCGYWLVSSDGGIFSFFGLGPFSFFLGSLPSLHIHPRSPIIGIAAGPGGLGYWLVGSDGGIFSFGDAGFHGSLPALGVHPTAPITGITRNPAGGGYWLVGSDGGIFSFGDAGFHGSLPTLIDNLKSSAHVVSSPQEGKPQRKHQRRHR